MNSHVTIIGAGPSGLCLSLALAAKGMQVDVIEKQTDDVLAKPEFDGREVALNHASIRLLKDLCIWSRLPEEAMSTLRQARIMDGNDPGFTVNGAPFGKDKLGILVSNYAIRQAAWEAAQANPDIHFHAGIEVESIHTDGTAKTHLSNGETIENRLIVAADSRFSKFRRMMGIATHMHDFGQTMLLSRIKHDTPNDGTAWEWFGQDITRALLPLDTHLSSAILTLPEIKANVLMQLPEKAFAEEVANFFEGRLENVELASTRHAYPMVGTWARRFVAPRFALVGDAAVGMHPVTAHGFNLGLASVHHLAEAAEKGLQQHSDPGHPAFLARYQRKHRTSSVTMFAGTQTVATMFTDKRTLLKPLRKAIMVGGRRLPPMRRALVASLLDDTPRLGFMPRHAVRSLKVLWPQPPHLRSAGMHS